MHVKSTLAAHREHHLSFEPYQNHAEPYMLKSNVKISTFVCSDAIGLFFRVRQHTDLSSNCMNRATRFVGLKLSIHQIKCTFHPFILMGYRDDGICRGLFSRHSSSPSSTEESSSLSTLRSGMDP